MLGSTFEKRNTASEQVLDRNSKKKNSFFYKCAADQITNLTLTSFNSRVITNYSVRTSS